MRCPAHPGADSGHSSSDGAADKPLGAPVPDLEQRFRRYGAGTSSSFHLDVEHWWAEVPQVRVRNLSWRQAQQLAELTVLNERLAAGNEGPTVIAVRKRIEWLRARRRVWERIYNYVTKQDAAATLAVIEDANSKVAAALSEEARERTSVGALKRRLVKLQAEVAAAHERLHTTQESVAANLSRIEELQAEAAALEAGTPPQSRNGNPLGLELRPPGTQPDKQPGALGAGQATAVKDECAHRACPLSLGKVVDGHIQCPYHGWEYDAGGSVIPMDAHRRIAALQQHLSPAAADEAGLCIHPTAAVEAEREYSVALPERLTPTGPWLVHRNAGFPDRLVSSFPAPDEHIRTLYDNLELSVMRHAKVPYLGERSVNAKGQAGQYEWMTYAEAGEARTAIGSGLLHYGLTPGAAVGLYSVNSRDWVLVDAACSAYSMVSVPLYDTLGPDAVRYICNHAELAAVACAAAVLPTLLQCLSESPTVVLVVVFGRQKGQSLPGPPPGCHWFVHAEIRHHSFCSTATSLNVYLGYAGDRHISYLPLAHIYERVTVIGLTHCGVSIGFYCGDVAELLEDVQMLRPTIFTSVPRLWNRIHDRVMATVRAGNPLARRLFAAAYASKKAALQAGDASGGRFGPLWDRLVFSKIKARVGGEVRLMTTGASPISAEVMDFLRICFGATVIEGYGMTETACTICMTAPGDTSSGHVGGPLACCEVKLADIPEMGYTTADRPHPRGEICVRGPTVFQGYFKDEVQTAEILDADGWLHTGDVGTWLPGGRLRVIDRKKNIFKLAQGEYIAPEKIENVYMRSPLVAQCFVYGDSLCAALVAIVVPDPEALLPWAAGRGLPQDLGRLCSDPSVTAAVLRSMLEEGRAAKLRGFEQVAAIRLTPDAFSVENGMLTPTFKLKRPQAKAAYEEAVQEMYSMLKS
ncbi:hypothetical protein WJX81_007254 [Elliptochloris bilobata]|uniref:Rieske domain-containing protein n=1 Tax=Elliptochloris bilobata TaxID=381761 RepID=A0AAW1RPY3_9CHLO